MSWRLLLTVLLLALGAAAWGGIQLGDWLVAHAPRATPAPGQESDLLQQPILDANGRPYVAQPPQPRIDGTLGVPDKPDDTQWTVPMVSLFDTVTDPAVQISRDGGPLAKEPGMAAHPPGGMLTSPSDIQTLDLQAREASSSGGPAVQDQQPSNTPARASGSPAPMRAPPSATAPPAGAKGWQEALKRELANCANQGFFERASCSWNARNRYCEPNQAWGTIPECPRKGGS